MSPGGSGARRRRAPAAALARLLLALCLLLPAARPAAAASGSNGVVAAEHVLASRAGLAILQKGGNAVDAAVATAFAVCVVNPSSCGIGGGGFMVVHLAAEKRTVTLDYRETAPAAASAGMFVRDGEADPELSRRSGLAVGVPGEVRGLATMLARHGTIPLAEALAPAIRLARGGFPAGRHLAATIAENRDAIAARPLLARNFLRQDGSAKQEGDKITLPELAATLEKIAVAGPDAFYKGEVAAAIVAAAGAAGGVLTEADLAGFEPVWRDPVALDFAGHRVVTMAPPSSAGVALEVLGMLAGDDLRALGHDSLAYTHLLAEAMKHGFADRARLYGDPLGGATPLPQLLAPDNLRTLRRRIDPAGVLASDRYGSQPGSVAEQKDDHGTSHLSVMDRHGNAVACTTTINTAFGAMLVAGDTGVILNNEMDDFSAQPGAPNVYGLVGAEANAIAPGKRPLSSMSPTIVLRDGEAVAALGGSGGPLILSATLQTLLNTVVFGMDAEAAVAAPRIHHQWLPPVLLVEPGISSRLQRRLVKRGHLVREFGASAAVQLTRRTADGFAGASDPRKGGEAAAW